MNAEQQEAVERLTELAGNHAFKLCSPIASMDLQNALDLIAELAKDKERLDWMEKKEMIGVDDDGDAVCVITTITPYTLRPDPSFRPAIDAAMEQSK